jgi:hypothetical protein
MQGGASNRRLPAIELPRRLSAWTWQRVPADPGAQGPRWYDWAMIEAADLVVTEGGGLHSTVPMRPARYCWPGW